jgi:hypothetical protein
MKTRDTFYLEMAFWPEMAIRPKMAFCPEVAFCPEMDGCLIKTVFRPKIHLSNFKWLFGLTLLLG